MNMRVCSRFIDMMWYLMPAYDNKSQILEQEVRVFLLKHQQEIHRELTKGHIIDSKYNLPMIQ